MTGYEEPGKAVWTIGHSRHPIHDFLSLLSSQAIEILVDVRTSPFSRMAPQYNKAQIRDALENAGIRYVHMPELGGRPEAAEMYDSQGYVFYNLVADSIDFQAGIARLCDGISRYKAAIMCSEGSPDICHRTLLVGRVLQSTGIQVVNILPSGEVAVLPDQNAGSTTSTLFGEEDREWKSAVSVRQAPAPSDSSNY